MNIRPSDLSLALRTIASHDVSAFRIAVSDEHVRQYMHDCRAGALSKVNTLVWSRGFARNVEVFRTACREREPGELDLGLPPEILAGTGERGLLLAEKGASKVADAETWNARLSALSIPTPELDAFIEFALTCEPQKLMLSMLGNDPVKKLAELSDVDWETLAPHFIWRQHSDSPVPTADILRYHRAGMMDPLNLERAYQDELPDEYGRALDA